MTRLELVKSYTATMQRNGLAPSHALALILMAGNAQGLTREEYEKSSGLSYSAVRHVLDLLVERDLALRKLGCATPPSPKPPYIYHLTENGVRLAHELLNTSA